MKTCLFGQHQWGAWTYPVAGDCRQVRACNRPECGARGEQIKHEWDAWVYTTADGCTQERACRRCAALETRTEHTWAALYVAETSCWKELRCERCGKPCDDLLVKARGLPQIVRPAHQWSDWQAQPNVCADRRECLRCGETQSRDVAHTWGEWAYTAEGACTQTRACRRCQSEERREEHDWGEWTYRGTQVCDMTRTCQRCRETQTDPDRGHDWSAWQYYDRRANSVMAYCCRCSQAVRRRAVSSQSETREAVHASLRRALDRFFTGEELKTLCGDLGVDYDNLGGEGKVNKARDLIDYCESRDELAKLAAVCFSERPQARL